MLYPIIRPLAAIALRVFFRKIYLSNAQRIPKGKPVILAANHPTAFMEPCILACFLNRPLYFLVRGDLFVKPLYIRLLRNLHMLPVYRMKDGGYQKLKHNYSTFENCYTALAANKTLMILAEGRTIHEKRLRPIQKGTARIAFGALERNVDLEDVYIVPVGVNYTFADQFRSEVMIDVGEPFSARKYFSRHRENPNPGIAAFTDHLREELKKRVIIIEKIEDENLVEQLFVLHRTEHPSARFPVISSSNERLYLEKSIADDINGMPEDHKRLLKEKADAYFRRLYALDIEDIALVKKSQGLVSGLFFLVFGAAPLLAGLLLNLPPVLLATYIADSRVHHLEFYASVKVAVGLAGYIIYIVLWFVVAFILGSRTLQVIGLLMPFLGYFAVVYLDIFREWKPAYQVKKLDAADKKNLLDQRKEVISQYRNATRIARH